MFFLFLSSFNLNTANMNTVRSSPTQSLQTFDIFLLSSTLLSNSYVQSIIFPITFITNYPHPYPYHSSTCEHMYTMLPLTCSLSWRDWCWNMKWPWTCNYIAMDFQVFLLSIQHFFSHSPLSFLSIFMIRHVHTCFRFTYCVTTSARRVPGMDIHAGRYNETAD